MSVNAVLYARVSTRDQAEEGYSLSAQARLLKDYAARREVEIAREFTVPESASGRFERKTFNEMLDCLARDAGIKYILCEKVDRITRNFRDAVKLDEWLNEDEERQVHFVKQGLVIHKHAKSNEKFQWDIYLALARQYSNNLSEEARKGLAQKAAEGWFPGGRKKGYVTVSNGSRKVLAIDNSPGSEAPFIRKAFELYDRGNHSIERIAGTLHAEGWKRSDGKPIGKSELHEILSDCFYCGEFVWKGRHYPAARHPALISKALFYSVKEKLQRGFETGKPQRHAFLFGNGLIRCGECGRAIIATVAKGHVYYYCTRYRKRCSQKINVRQEELERQVAGILGKLKISAKLAAWIRQALKDSHEAEEEYHARALAKLDEDYRRVQKRLDALYDDKLDEKITGEFYQRKLEQYQGELNAVANQKRQHQSAAVDYYELGTNVLKLAEIVASTYESRSREEKRQLLKIVCSNLFLKAGKLHPDYHPAFRLLVELGQNGKELGEVDSNHH